MTKQFSAILITLLGIQTFSMAQVKAADSVVLRVGEASKVIFAIHDKKDLETLKHYDFQALMNDMITKLENNDSSQLDKSSSQYIKDTTRSETEQPTVSPSESTSDTENWGEIKKNKKHWRRGTHHTFNIDLGTNNYLSDGKFPDESNELYSVRPWGSWYVGLNQVMRTRVTRKFFIEWGAGVSWYNFKFQNDRTLITKNPDNISFSEDIRDFNFTKSKLTVAYINVNLIPMIDFGGNRRKASLFDGYHSDSFRIGMGPYIGYRIDSYSKSVYDDQGEKNKEHNRSNYFLNNFRYGARLQFGFDDVDFFFNYDLNELFVENKGPQLNAFSFGVTF